MAATTAFGIPYPQLTDDVDVPDDIRLLAEALQDLLAEPVCKLILPSNFGVANNSNTVTIPFGAGSEAIKTDAGMHSTTTNNTRMIATKKGFYFATAVGVTAVNTSGFRTCSIGKNGVRQGPEAGIYNSAALPSGANTILPPVVGVFDMNVGDYLEMFIFQNSGGILNAIGDGLATSTGNCVFTMHRIRAKS